MTHTITPQPDTEPVEDSRPIDHDSDRPTRLGRTMGSAFATFLVGATGLLAYRAINGPSEPTAPADTSHETAEQRRHLSFAPDAAADRNTNSFDRAEYAPMRRLADEDPFDRAEYARMRRLADGFTDRP